MESWTASATWTTRRTWTVICRRSTGPARCSGRTERIAICRRWIFWRMKSRDREGAGRARSARSLTVAALLLRTRRRRRHHVDAFALPVELDDAVGQREKGVVLAAADVA